MSVATNENKARHTAIWLPRGTEINPNTWLWLNTPPAGHGCNPCTHEARSTRAQGKKQQLAGSHASQISLLSGLLTVCGGGKTPH